MGKIDIFKGDNQIGDKVVIYRNYGNEDIEGIVSEIGDVYVVLLKENGRKSRVFEDIISGWDTIATREEMQVSVASSTPTPQNSKADTSISEAKDEGKQNLEQGMAQKSESQEEASDVQSKTESKPVIESSEMPEQESSEPLQAESFLEPANRISFEALKKIDLSKGGDLQLKKVGDSSTIEEHSNKVIEGDDI